MIPTTSHSAPVPSKHRTVPFRTTRKREGTTTTEIRPADKLNLRSLRKSSGLTASEVAQKMGVATTGVERLDAADDCKLSTLVRYARALGKPVTVTITADFVMVQTVEN